MGLDRNWAGWDICFCIHEIYVGPIYLYLLHSAYEVYTKHASGPFY